ncbi:Tim44 domain-containing protein [Massilia cavernae]|uniref:Tim44 domain-containing protein n=1 Tax=Massilia cavernae TaxID=2320864 RepID=A0A418X818_9BURK|nr:Tim44-like domain-containing protein [Massilia cavernae]RJG08548.1 Tim44 domain-containing protein [Massilia cavernae]
MKKLLATMVIAVMTMSMVVEADARPLGGKRSFGRQSPAAAKQAQTPPPVQAPTAAQTKPATAGAAAAAAPAAAAAKGGMWKGILGGALLGLGLGALLSHFGLGGAAASMIAGILMIALLALAGLFIWRMFKRKDTPANSAFEGFSKPVPVGAGAGTPEIGSGLPRAASQPAYQPAAFQPAMPASAGASQPAVTTPYGVPSDFDTANFLRHAKSSFIRMQAAWDKADFNDLREFTTPEVYAELKMQIQERGDVAEFTDVVSIDADLLGIETTAVDYLASVRFTGMIKPAADALAEPFVEVWNMSKPVNGSTGWVLAGIQQLS